MKKEETEAQISGVVSQGHQVNGREGIPIAFSTLPLCHTDKMDHALHAW